MEKISAFIIACNEEARISIAINSLRIIASEIIVIDSGSVDNTRAIVEELGAKFIYNPWPGYTKQKCYGESQCRNDWIINIDADECLSAELQDEIEYIFASKHYTSHYAYQMEVVILHRNDTKPRMFAPRNRCIRLYNKKHGGFYNAKYDSHDSVIMNSGYNKVCNLNEAIFRRSGISIEQLVAKANFYSTEQAKDLAKSGRVISKLRIGSEILFLFLKAFFIRRYFVFGFDGFVDSVIFAFARFLRLAKARELIMNNPKQRLISDK